MTVELKPGDTLFGYPLVTVRNVLRSWRRRKGSAQLRDLSSVKKLGVSASDYLTILQGAQDKGWIRKNNEKYAPYQDSDFTPHGLSFLAASGRKRVPKEKARSELKNLLAHFESLNADRKNPLRVEKVWLFGSMLDEDKDTVGDIDLVVETGRKKSFSDLRFRDLEKKMASLAGAALPDSVGFGGDIYDWFERRSLWGQKKKPIFSSNDLSQLEGLHVPCQLVFDHQRKGVVNDAVLEHHPDSKRRGSGFPQRSPLDLNDTETLPAPVSTSWFSVTEPSPAFSNSGLPTVYDVGAFGIPRRQMIHQMGPRAIVSSSMSEVDEIDHGKYTLADEKLTEDQRQEISEALKEDGVSVFAFPKSRFRGDGLHGIDSELHFLERRIEKTDKGVEIRYSLSSNTAVELPEFFVRAGQSLSWAAFLMSVDFRRVHAHRAALGEDYRIDMIHNCDFGEMGLSVFAEQIFDHLILSDQFFGDIPDHSLRGVKYGSGRYLNSSIDHSKDSPSM